MPVSFKDIFISSWHFLFSLYITLGYVHLWFLSLHLPLAELLALVINELDHFSTGMRCSETLFALADLAYGIAVRG